MHTVRFFSLRFGAAAAAALVYMASPGAARPSESVLGSLAEECATLAKAESASRAAVDVCTRSILGDYLFAHDLATTYLNRGTLYLGLMAWGPALADFDAALRIEPDMPEAYVNRGGALIGLKRYGEAVADLDRGIALNSSQLEKAYGNRALAKWSLDDLRGAYLDFMRAQELKPDWAWPAEQLAQFTLSPAAAAN